MKIVVVASTFPAADDDGVPAFVRDQVIAMRQIDPSLRIDVLAPHDRRSRTTKVREHEHYRELRFHYAWPRSIEVLAGRGIMPSLQANRLLYPLVLPLFVFEFFALLGLTRRTRPDVLYAHWFTPQAIVACWVGMLTNTPFVFTTHASDVSVWQKIPWLGRHIVRFHVRRARHFTAVSRRSMDKLAAFFTPSEWEQLRQRGSLLPMGVQELAASDEPGDSSRLLFIGRLVEKKGVHVLLESFARLRTERPDLTLTVAGDGPLRADLEAQAARLGLGPESVTFAGYLTGADKARAMAEHGVYVVPSIITDSGDAEGLPVSLMEGLAAGKICVATAESGADDILDGTDAGLLVPHKDAVALHVALRTAVDLGPDERRAMSESARRTAEQFYWPSVARQHLTVLFPEKV